MFTRHRAGLHVLRLLWEHNDVTLVRIHNLCFCLNRQTGIHVLRKLENMFAVKTHIVDCVFLLFFKLIADTCFSTVFIFLEEQRTIYVSRYVELDIGTCSMIVIHFRRSTDNKLCSNLCHSVPKGPTVFVIRCPKALRLL